MAYLTAAEYIEQTFGGWGVTLSKADLTTILAPLGVVEADEVTADNLNTLTVGIVNFIPTLLLRPTSRSVSENGHSKSQSWDFNALRDYYSLMCRRLGLKDELTEKPRIKFL